MPRERQQVLGLGVGERVFVRPRSIRLFVEGAA
jgi:hypothetical protein